jgi:hypothetical protein
LAGGGIVGAFQPLHACARGTLDVNRRIARFSVKMAKPRRSESHSAFKEDSPWKRRPTR